MSGHVFTIQGDLTSLACDAWLLPTAGNLHITESWRHTARDGLTWDRGRLRVDTPDGWGDHGLRTFPFPHWWPAGGPTTWLTNVGGGHGVAASWFTEAVRQFIVQAARALKDGHEDPQNGRAKHLLALPLAGTGFGGGAAHKGEIVQALLPTLEEEARRNDVDVVLVTFGDEAFAAAQWARRRHGRGSLWTELRDEDVHHAERLAAEALDGRLVLFMGAGVSAGAGLPLWKQLLEQLADDADLTSREKEGLGELDLLDQARLLERRLQQRGATLGHAVAQHVKSSRYALTHGLLASLPCDEVVTLNYDDLFERASEAARRPAAILPSESATPGGRWLLKLHGTIDEPDDIVLTRTDYLRFAERRAALAGIVQALLITKHMLFVGFSLTDDNFHRIVEDVRRAVGPERAAGPATFGTALLLHERGLLTELWSDDLTCVAVGHDGLDLAEAARAMEVFLDLVLMMSTTNTSHLMDESFDGLLSRSERELRTLLGQLASGASSTLRQDAAWRPVERLLRDFGLRESGHGVSTRGSRRRRRRTDRR